MKLRHTAALALMGWYLIVPTPEMARARRDDVSLSRWYQIGSYDSADDCNQAKNGMLYSKSQSNADENWATSRLQCVADDDPRLKAK